jgi:cytidine deaminase
MAMHQAAAIALRSSDERRQVGAVIVERRPRSRSTIKDATIVAAGMNEVPRRQGGQYWHEDSPDHRDQALRDDTQGGNREDRIKLDTLREIAERLKEEKWLSPKYQKRDVVFLANELLGLLRHSKFMDISEFMRQVHAEMASIVDAAMRGVAVQGAEMYVTTFPCHGCAKHIIAAGITKVVYLEPYPKSRAERLHKEEIYLDPVDPNEDTDKVIFVPFTGVAPRQYARLFNMEARGRKAGLGLKEWKERQTSLSPRDIPANAAIGYGPIEREELRLLPAVYSWDQEGICPSK